MSETVNNSAVVRRNPTIIHAELEGEVVLLNADTGKYHGLDKTGTRIWNLLEEDTSVPDLCRQLREKYEVSEEQCMADLILFLEIMAENRLIDIR